MRQAVGLGSGRNITTAALPGTTLGAGSTPLQKARAASERCRLVWGTAHASADWLRTCR
jgi:hypothetical protein